MEPITLEQRGEAAADLRKIQAPATDGTWRRPSLREAWRGVASRLGISERLAGLTGSAFVAELQEIVESDDDLQGLDVDALYQEITRLEVAVGDWDTAPGQLRRSIADELLAKSADRGDPFLLLDVDLAVKSDARWTALEDARRRDSERARLQRQRLARAKGILSQRLVQGETPKELQALQARLHKETTKLQKLTTEEREAREACSNQRRVVFAIEEELRVTRRAS